MANITGGRELTDRLRRMADTVGPRLSDALLDAGEMIQKEAQISITEGAQSGKGHVASRPGEPPNNNLGTLANHIESVRVAPLKVEVSSNAPYAAHLEYGTSKMAARPYMEPAVAKVRSELPGIFSAAVKRGIADAKK